MDLEANKFDSDEEGGGGKGGPKDMLKSKTVYGSDSEESSNDNDDELDSRWRPQRGEERLTGHVGARTQGTHSQKVLSTVTYIVKVSGC